MLLEISTVASNGHSDQGRKLSGKLLSSAKQLHSLSKSSTVGVDTSSARYSYSFGFGD
jgi:hypothetical protein